MPNFRSLRSLTVVMIALSFTACTVSIGSGDGTQTAHNHKKSSKKKSSKSSKKKSSSKSKSKSSSKGKSSGTTKASSGGGTSNTGATASIEAGDTDAKVPKEIRLSPKVELDRSTAAPAEVIDRGAEKVPHNMRPVGRSFSGALKEGQTAEHNFAFKAGTCTSFVASGADGVSDVSIYVIEGRRTLAADDPKAPIAAIGNTTRGCLRFARDTNATVLIHADKGTGRIFLQRFE